MFLIDGFSDPYRCCIAEKTGRRFDIGGCGGLAANNIEYENPAEYRSLRRDNLPRLGSPSARSRPYIVASDRAKLRRPWVACLRW